VSIERGKRPVALAARWFKKMLLEPTDAVLRAKRAAERCGRVVELQRQAAFDPLGELYPIDFGRHQHVIMQIAIADVSIDGQLEIRVSRLRSPHLGGQDRARRSRST
jgi:hypothetical protein